MYTRFKSQKSGLKLGLNNIASNRKVVAPSSNMASSVCSTISTCSSNLSLTSNEPKSQKTSGETSPIYSPPASIINSVMTVSSILVDDNNNSLPNGNPSLADSTIIPFQYNDDEARKDKNTHGKKQAKNESSSEEPVDLTCISYVKSMWDKYSSEIGTQNGPLKHIDENEQYPHLDGFVAFDLEHWWAERSISSMIKQNSADNRIEEPKEANKNVLMTNTDPLFNAALKKSSSKINPRPHSSKYQTMSSMNNFTLCFS
ncbi:hypothetical protein BpHYR1_023707 [Brachionus plicatilis]|uniref:Uncharacterized protein n=1 Tax=Brachionus plicatilis TaxID=10195 RepID=A0A3M7RTN5_BRAPC|nr:hypothetical protein BpHYR1_023707 [Brachionus plicatilis]